MPDRKTDPAPALNLKAQILDLVAEAMVHADSAISHLHEKGLVMGVTRAGHDDFVVAFAAVIAMGRRLANAITLLAERELP